MLQVANKLSQKSASPVQAVPQPEVEGEVRKEEGNISKTITLKFPSGYSFTITIENRKMTVESKLRDRQAFLLDEIPEEFVRDLKNMLQEF